MPNNKTRVLRHAILNHVLRGNVGGTAFAQPSTLWVGLFTASPASDGTGGTEVSGNGYARVQVTFGAPSTDQVTNNVAVVFPKSTAAWGLITDLVIFDAATAGTRLYFGPTTPAIAVDAANRKVEFEVGTIVVQET